MLFLHPTIKGSILLFKYLEPSALSIISVPIPAGSPNEIIIVFLFDSGVLTFCMFRFEFDFFYLNWIGCNESEKFFYDIVFN